MASTDHSGFLSRGGPVQPRPVQLRGVVIDRLHRGHLCHLPRPSVSAVRPCLCRRWVGPRAGIACGTGSCPRPPRRARRARRSRPGRSGAGRSAWWPPRRPPRDAERQVEDDPDGGDQSSPLAGAGQRGQDAVGAQEEPRADARARYRGAGEEGGSRCRLDRGKGHHCAGEQGQAAGQHGRGAAEAAERDRGRGPPSRRPGRSPGRPTPGPASGAPARTATGPGTGKSR